MFLGSVMGSQTPRMQAVRRAFFDNLCFQMALLVLAFIAGTILLD
jgi:hypothetical protein